jgi:peptidoglycan/LPS O-acetylase OafA/YrhL
VTTPAQTYQKDYIATLDGLRGVAVLLVLWQHIPAFALPKAIDHWRQTMFGDWLSGYWPLWIDWLRDDVFEAGYLGVDLFFVLSGFLITRILLVDKVRGVLLRYFLARRFLRIFPIYYLTLFVVWIVEPAPELFWCAVYLSNFYYLFGPGGVMQHSWSLAIEEHFYLLWPLVVYSYSKTVSRRCAAWLIVPGALISTTVLAIGWHDNPPFVMKASQYGTMFRMAALALGALIAYFEVPVRSCPRRTVAWALIMVASGQALRCLLPPEFAGSFASVVRLVSYGLISPGLVMACIACNASSGLFGRALRSGLMRFFGRISYGLYLYHFVVYHWVGLCDDPMQQSASSIGVAIGVGVGATVVLAVVSYYVIERPCLRLAGRFRSDALGLKKAV